MLVLFLSTAYAYDISPNDFATQGPGDGSGTCLIASAVILGFLMIVLVVMQIVEWRKKS